MTLELAEIVRVVISYGGAAASVAQNVFMFEVQDSSADETAALDDLATWFTDQWLATWDGIADDTAQAFLMEVDILNTDGTVNRNIGERQLDVAGLSTAGILPAAVSGYMQASSERTGSIGRKYVPFLGEGTVANGVFDSTALGVLADLLAHYLSDIVIDTTSTLAPGILSRVVDAFFEFAVSGYTTNIPAYQRRRKSGVGS